MNGLKVQDFHGKQVIDSRDVAQMVEREHKELMKSIRIYAQYLAEGEIPLGDFFIESTYLDGNNQQRPNFLITKRGCDIRFYMSINLGNGSLSLGFRGLALLPRLDKPMEQR